MHDFSSRVIRDKRFKVWVDTNKKIERLHDLIRDPQEETNLLVIGGLTVEQVAVMRKFQAVVDLLPDMDARPIYEPRKPNAWDKVARKPKKSE